MATNRQLTGVCVPALDVAYSSLAHDVSCVNLSWTDKDRSFRSCSSAISDMYVSISRGSLSGSGSDGTPSNSEIVCVTIRKLYISFKKLTIKVISKKCYFAYARINNGNLLQTSSLRRLKKAPYLFFGLSFFGLEGWNFDWNFDSIVDAGLLLKDIFPLTCLLPFGDPLSKIVGTASLFKVGRLIPSSPREAINFGLTSN